MVLDPDPIGYGTVSKLTRITQGDGLRHDESTSIVSSTSLCRSIVLEVVLEVDMISLTL